MGLSLNLIDKATAFYKPMCVLDFISELLDGHSLDRPFSAAERTKVYNVLKNVLVETHLEKSAYKQYKFDKLTPEETAQLTTRGKKKTGLFEYYKKQHRCTLLYPHLPSILVKDMARKDTPTYLPVEVCWIVKKQRYTKCLDKVQMPCMGDITTERPKEKHHRILRAIESNTYDNDDLLNDCFGITVDEKMTKVTSRILEPPSLMYRDSSSEWSSVKPYEGQWNMDKLKVFEGGDIGNWALINFSDLTRDELIGCCDNLIADCAARGIPMHSLPVIGHSFPSENNIEETLKKVFDECNDKLKILNRGPLQVLFVILPPVDDVYSRVKSICDRELRIVTQCLKKRTVNSYDKNVLRNISLQVNVKVGGTNTVLSAAFGRKFPFVDQWTIIFGADVTHPSQKDETGPSIAAVVATMDPLFSKYKWELTPQLHGQEIIENMQLSSRDGVGEDQIAEVLEKEVDAIRKACKMVEKNYEPSITFIVVQKRHHTRLFPVNHLDWTCVDRTGNVMPGTVVDTKICYKDEFDYILSSHYSRQGTSRPCHYHVLCDENNFTSDQLQHQTTYVTTTLCL